MGETPSHDASLDRTVADYEAALRHAPADWPERRKVEGCLEAVRR